jgi:hypothetical protein
MKEQVGAVVYLHSFLNSALDGCDWSASLTGREPIQQGAGWTPEPVWVLYRREKATAPAGK